MVPAATTITAQDKENIHPERLTNIDQIMKQEGPSNAADNDDDHDLGEMSKEDRQVAV